MKVRVNDRVRQCVALLVCVLRVVLRRFKDLPFLQGVLPSSCGAQNRAFGTQQGAVFFCSAIEFVLVDYVNSGTGQQGVEEDAVGGSSSAGKLWSSQADMSKRSLSAAHWTERTALTPMICSDALWDMF